MNRRDILKFLGVFGGIAAIDPAKFLHNPIFQKISSKVADSQIMNMLETERKSVSEVKTERGGPRLFVNGKEEYPFLEWSWRLYDYTPCFKRSGIDFYTLIIRLGDSWAGPGEFDFFGIDRFMINLLKLNRNAFFLPRLLLNAPNWWKDSHPDEIVKCAIPVEHDKLYNKKNGYLVGEGGQRWYTDLYQVSFASEIWKKDTGGLLTAYLRHVERSPLRSRMLGYHIGNGTTGGEWHYFDSAYLPDFSEPMRRAAGDIPDKEERLNSKFGLFRDPEKEKRVIDFYAKFHDISSDTILFFARLVKKETGGNGYFKCGGDCRGVRCEKFFCYRTLEGQHRLSAWRLVYGLFQLLVLRFSGTCHPQDRRAG